MRMNAFFFPLVIITVLISSLTWGQSTLKIVPEDSPEDIIRKAAQVVPTANQYDYKKLEFTCFVHFGPNTFTRKEWGNGMEDPRVFALENLDTDQWCQAMQDAGMTLVVFTAKHHDGFVLWQSRYTEHGVMSSPFRGGKGDVLRDLAASCKKYGLKLGVYLSPADLYQIESPEGLYGNLSKYTERIIPRPVAGRPFANKTTFKFKADDYNEYFLNQLFELLTEYGPIHEVWFDGAHPKRKGGQQYNYLAWKQLISTLAPQAVIFGKEDVRWCGNEAGGTRESEWDIIPYSEDPHRANNFPDQRGADLGSREKLMSARYLHYWPAETNTSIRAGWFYRDEETQAVRCADDVFDIYERAVGGNSTFLLNIPPNREGRFSEKDVWVLREVGRRIRATYGTDLLAGASGNQALLDDDEGTWVLGESEKEVLILTLPQPIVLNRFVVQEAIKTHGQRVEKHALDAWINGQWETVAKGTVVGYKKILRFPVVTTDRLRLRILAARDCPCLSKVAAHYYAPRPPQLTIERTLDGQVTIAVRQDGFNWKPHGVNYRENLGQQVKIHYTTDGSEPDRNAAQYSGPFLLAAGKVKARALVKHQAGSIAEREFGIIKQDWTISADSSGHAKHKVEFAIDGDSATYWHSGSTEVAPSVTIDLHRLVSLTGLVYTPPTDCGEGLLEQGLVKLSKDGSSWQETETFVLGNLINDPTPRTVPFAHTTVARYVQLVFLRGAGGSSAGTIAEIDLLVEE